MKQDTVKEMKLCRKCLKSPLIPHLPRDCKAPICSKCGQDNNGLICPKPAGTQIFAGTMARGVQQNIYGERSIYDDFNETLIHSLNIQGNQGSFVDDRQQNYMINEGGDQAYFNQGDQFQVQSLQESYETYDDQTFNPAEGYG